ncbi:MAG: energy transducer TonB [Roseococcus sp.]
MILPLRWAPRRPEEGAGWGGLVSLLLHGALLAALLLPGVARREALPQTGLELVWDPDSPETVGEGGAASPETAPDPAPAEEAPDPAPAEEAPAPPAPVLAEAPPAPEPAAAPPPPPPSAPAPAQPLPPPADPALVPPPAAPPDAASPEPAGPPPSSEPPPPAEPAPPAEPPPPAPPPPAPEAPRPEPARPERPRPARPSAARPPAAATRPGAPGPDAPGADPPGQGLALGPTTPPEPDERYPRAAPAYPEMARARGEQGVVVLELAIGTDGRVITARVARSSGFPMLDEAARRAAQEWRFRPARIEGQPTLATVQAAVQFRLQ